MRKTVAVVLGLALVAAAVASDDEVWGKAAAGLRLRAEAPPQPIGGSPLVRMLDFELRSESGEVTPLRRLGVRPRFVVGDRGALPSGIYELPTITPLELRDGELAAGGSLRWYPRLIRTGEDAPKRFTCKAVLPVRNAKEQLFSLESLPFEVDLSRFPAPRKLEEKHLEAGWTGGSVLVYRENQEIYGWRALEVWPDGTARAFRTAHGSGDDEVPAGLHRARLTAEQQNALAATLRRLRVWTITDSPPPKAPRPHATHLDVVVIEGGAAVIAKIRLGADEDYERVNGLRKAMRALMITVVEQGKKKPR